MSIRDEMAKVIAWQLERGTTNEEKAICAAADILDMPQVKALVDAAEFMCKHYRSAIPSIYTSDTAIIDLTKSLAPFKAGA